MILNKEKRKAFAFLTFSFSSFLPSSNDKYSLWINQHCYHIFVKSTRKHEKDVNWPSPKQSIKKIKLFSFCLKIYSRNFHWKKIFFHSFIFLFIFILLVFLSAKKKDLMKSLHSKKLKLFFLLSMHNFSFRIRMKRLVSFLI